MATDKKAKEPRSAKDAAEQTASSTQTAKPADTRTSAQKRKMLTGVVVSDKMQKTIVVRVDHRVRHTLYRKYVMRSQRFKAHDEKNDAKKGDMVRIVESRPLSKDKRWALQAIVRRAGQAPELNV